MAISQPIVTLIEVDGADAIAPSKQFDLHPAATGVVFRCFFNQNADVIVDTKGPDGVWRQLNTNAVTGDEATNITYGTNLGSIRVRVEAGATPISGYVVAHYFGHAGSLS